MSRVALLLHMAAEGAGPVPLAVLVFVETVPGALFAPVAGVWTDRDGARRMLIGSDLVRAGLLAVVAMYPQPAIIYVVAALHSIATVFFDTARVSAIPFVVPPADIPRANSAEQVTASLVLVVAPAAGAELLNAFGVTIVMAVDAASFVLSAGCIVATAIPRHAVATAAVDTLDGMRDGWRYLARHPLALQLNVLLFIGLVCAGMWRPLAPSFVTGYLGAEERWVGWQLGALGLGALAGGVIARPIAVRLGSGAAVVAGFLAEGCAIIVYALVSDPLTSTMVVFLWGASVSIIVVPFYSLLHQSVDRLYIGRVFAVVKQSENVATALAMGLAVAFGARFAAATVLLLAGVMYVSATLASSLSGGGRALLQTR